MKKNGYDGARDRTATTGLKEIVRNGMRIDSPEAAVEHLEKFAFPALEKRAAEFDEDAAVREMLIGEAVCQAEMGPEILKAPEFARCTRPDNTFGTDRMGQIRKVYDAWETARSLMLCPLITFAAGWLTSESLRGRIAPWNRVAAYILLAVSCCFVAVLVLVGGNRWRKGLLTPQAKVVLCASLILLAGFFVLGWHVRVKRG